MPAVAAARIRSKQKSSVDLSRALRVGANMGSGSRE